jgi:hypothetical protein
MTEAFATGIVLALAVACTVSASASNSRLPQQGAGTVAPAAAAPAGAVSYLLRAGREVQAIGALQLRRQDHAITYADAIRAFGKPSSCRWFSHGQVALARWKRLGVRMWLATLGGLPPGANGCSSPRLIHIDVAIVAGNRWHTAPGLQVGDTVADLKALYPNAIYQRRKFGRMAAPAYWIVHVRERCVIGICPTRYVTVARLTAQVQAGKVVAFFFPVGAQGE